LGSDNSSHGALEHARRGPQQRALAAAIAPTKVRAAVVVALARMRAAAVVAPMRLRSGNTSIN